MEANQDAAGTSTSTSTSATSSDAKRGGIGGPGFRPNLNRGGRKPVPLASPTAAFRPAAAPPGTEKRKEMDKEPEEASQDSVGTPPKKPRIDGIGGPPPVVSARGPRPAPTATAPPPPSASSGPPAIKRASTLKDVLRANTGTPMPRTGVEEQVRSISRPVSREPVEQAPTLALGPQVRLDENGNVVLDQQSLTVTNIARDESANYEIIHEDEGNTNFQRHRWKNKREKWTQEQTDQFYMALRKFGTDFTLIGVYMNRSRDQIRNKFKKEEKENSQRISRAIDRRMALDQEDQKLLAERAKQINEQEKRQREAKERGESEAQPSLLDKIQPRSQGIAPVAGPVTGNGGTQETIVTPTEAVTPYDYDENRYSDDDRYEGDYYDDGDDYGDDADY